MTLADLKPGQKANILGITKGVNAERRLFEMGIIPGTTIELISKHPLKGPLVLEIGNAQIALGRKVASFINIEIT